jgi:hypothetical protein
VRELGREIDLREEQVLKADSPISERRDGVSNETV